MSRTDEAAAVAGRLKAIGAHKGAGTVAFNALLMSQAKRPAPAAPVPANDAAPISIVPTIA